MHGARNISVRSFIDRPSEPWSCILTASFHALEIQTGNPTIILVVDLFSGAHMNQFSVVERPSEGMISYELSGYVNELSVFPKPVFAPTVRINLENVTGLNSVGTKIWCTWVAMIKPPTLIRLEKCPFIFIRCFNQVSGSYLDNMQVISMKIPYYSEGTGERSEALLLRDTHFDARGKIAVPDLLDSKGNKMDLDVTDEYFRFLIR